MAKIGLILHTLFEFILIVGVPFHNFFTFGIVFDKPVRNGCSSKSFQSAVLLPFLLKIIAGIRHIEVFLDLS